MTRSVLFELKETVTSFSKLLRINKTQLQLELLGLISSFYLNSSISTLSISISLHYCSFRTTSIGIQVRKFHVNHTFNLELKCSGCANVAIHFYISIRIYIFHCEIVRNMSSSNSQATVYVKIRQRVTRNISPNVILVTNIHTQAATQVLSCLIML